MPRGGKPVVRVEPLWTRVERNRLKVTLFLVTFLVSSATLFSLALTFAPVAFGALALMIVEAQATYSPLTYGGYLSAVARLSWVSLAVFALSLSVGAVAVARALRRSFPWLARVLGADRVMLHDLPQVRSLLHDVTLAAGLKPLPELWLVHVDSVNAFAAGPIRGRRAIGVTQGLLDSLTADEQRAVLATLAARLRAGDALVATAVAALMGPLDAIHRAEVPRVFDLDLFDPDYEDDEISLFPFFEPFSLRTALHGVGIGVVMHLTWHSVRLAAGLIGGGHAVSHRLGDEKADVEGMLLLKDPAPMLSALQKVIVCHNHAGPGGEVYDGLFYCPTAGTPEVTRQEDRRLRRLREVLGPEGAADTGGAAGGGA